MSRSHLLSAFAGAIVALLLVFSLGFAPQAQPANDLTSVTFPWGNDKLSAQSIAVAVEYEEEWHKFFNKGVVLADDPAVKSIGTSKRMLNYLTISSSIRSISKQANSDFAGSIEAGNNGYIAFATRLNTLRTERTALLNELIKGPFETRLQEDLVDELFPPNTD